MSMWNVSDLFEKGNNNRPRTGIWKYTKWANPFHNSVKNMQTIACESAYYLDIEMLYPGIGDWFFTQFVPSPVELVRKTLVGGYRCGFYLKVKVKSPVDIIWRDGSGSRFLAKIVRPFSTAAFWIWGQQTIWEGLSLWQTMVYMKEWCDEPPDECICGGGSTPLTIAPNGGGNLQAGLDIWDPNGWHEGLEGSIHIPPNSYTSCRVYFEVQSVGATLANLTIRLKRALDTNTADATVFSGSVGLGEHLSFALDNSAGPVGPDDWTLPMTYEGLVKQTELSHVAVIVHLMAAKSGPAPFEEPCPPWQPSINVVPIA